MNSNDPWNNNFQYKKYSLEQLDNWVNDALNCEDLTPEDIYDTIVNVVDESVEYHKKYLTKSIELLSLLKGNRSFEIDTSLDDVNPSSGVSSATQKDWNDFWRSDWTSGAERYPCAYVYTDEEMSAMSEYAAKQMEKERIREYNLRESEYYDKRAKLDAKYNDMIDKGYTLTDDGFWIKETEKGVASVSIEPRKTWSLPVEQSVVDGVEDYYITFPDDLLKAADLKEGDSVEWIDRKDGSYELRKACPVCPPCENEMFSPE